MYKSLRKIVSVILAAAIVTLLATAGISVGAAEESGEVRVIVENTVYSTESGATWDGTLIDETVSVDSDSTALTALVDALEANGYSQEGAESGYVTSINGLSEFDGGSMSGWMSKLNDWFTSEGMSAYTIASGKLESGDEICFSYTCAWGSDIGSNWSGSSTKLSAVSFDTGELSEKFDSDVTEYTLTVPYDTETVTVTPTAENKNFQVRAYLNNYTPDEDGTEYKRSQAVPVADGDKIYIGVGESGWASMNSGAESSVYTFNIVFEEAPQPVGSVRVTVRNDVYSVESGSDWDGVLIDDYVSIYEDSTAISAVADAIESNGFSQTGAESGYITEIFGLASGDASSMSGWMATINDWFTSEGLSSYSVANGTLEDGDEIAMMYTDSWGSDISSYWNDTTTTLASLGFSAGELSEEFDPDVTEYTLVIPEDVTSLVVSAEAFNKNYQVRTYLDEYTPEQNGFKKSEDISVTDGNVIYIGVGDSSWPSMNSSSGGTVYKVTVEYEKAKYDFNLDGTTDVDDVTTLQRYLADLIDLSDEVLADADIYTDGKITIDDVTALQMYLVYSTND